MRAASCRAASGPSLALRPGPPRARPPRPKIRGLAGHRPVDETDRDAHGGRVPDVALEPRIHLGRVAPTFAGLEVGKLRRVLTPGHHGPARGPAHRVRVLVLVHLEPPHGALQCGHIARAWARQRGPGRPPTLLGRAPGRADHDRRGDGGQDHDQPDHHAPDPHASSSSHQWFRGPLRSQLRRATPPWVTAGQRGWPGRRRRGRRSRPRRRGRSRRPRAARRTTRP